MTTLRLVACILTLNEEANIREAIRSVTPLTKHVYVVDSGSSDRTVSLAQEAGAIVLTNKPDRFLISEQRNWALDQLAEIAEWVIFLDADERATPDFVAEVAAVALEGTADGYFAAPRFIYQGTWLRRFMGFPNWHPRLVRVGHERLSGGVWEKFESGKNVGFLSEPYDHDADSKGLDDWVARHLRYAHWEARPSDGSAALERRAGMRLLARRSGPLRPWAVLLYHLFIRGGWRDGGSVWSYARRQLIYQLLISEAQREAERTQGSAG
jgi:glycosyltransferase involved in cell wall biosynthesis